MDEYIPANTVTLLSSVSGVGKSVLALHLGLSLLAGRDWLGLKSRQGVFAYWDQDNPDTWLSDNRLSAIARGMGITLADLPRAEIFRTRGGKVLGNDLRLRELTQWLKEKGARVLFIDTLASVNPYAENDPNEMARAICDNLFPLVYDGITPIVLHHIGKDLMGKSGPTPRTGIHAPRGSSALAAAVGTAFNLGGTGEARTLECVKPRYGSVPPIKLDYDEDGYAGSDDWKITLKTAGVRVNQKFLVQWIRDHDIKSMSSRNLVKMLRDNGYVASQMTASRALNQPNAPSPIRGDGAD